MGEGLPSPAGQPLSAAELRERRSRARARRTRRRRRATLLVCFTVLAITAGVWIALGGGGRGGPPRPLPATRAARQHRVAKARVVRLVVEASGDLLIHSPI